MTEAEFTRQVIQLATLCKWRVLHLRPARTRHGWRTAVSGHGVGFPDVLAVKGRRLLAAELKVRAGTTAEQRNWLAALGFAGAEVYVWRPGDFPEIERVLGGRG